ncbi:MAG: hypothetical protein Q9162_005712 [Coniocarpon cinnabarinum]
MKGVRVAKNGLLARTRGTSLISSCSTRRSNLIEAPGQRPRSHATGAQQRAASSLLAPHDTFSRRHIGVPTSKASEMLTSLDPPVSDLDTFVDEVMPMDIKATESLKIDAPARMQTMDTGEGFSESQLIARISEIASQNEVFRSYIGCGYYGTIVPEVIKRNVLENPAWYTSYTPYQAEISQGRLESLLNYQTMISDLTGLSISNASLLDEPTAAAEAMTLSINTLPAKKAKNPNKKFFVSNACLPQTIAVLSSRAHGFGIELVVGDATENGGQALKDIGDDLIGALVQYPDVYGDVHDFTALSKLVHDVGGTFCVATDLLALTLLKSPGEIGADVAVGSAQRLGVPFGFGGPHAAFIAVGENHKRKIPGRLVGLSKDRRGEPAVRLALQTREQHIRREKATSNICTAQVLLANMSAFYAIYHGPQGLQRIAAKNVALARLIQSCAHHWGYSTGKNGFNEAVNFDTVVLNVHNHDTSEIIKHAETAQRINFRRISQSQISLTVDETMELTDVVDVLKVLEQYANAEKQAQDIFASELKRFDTPNTTVDIPAELARASPYLTHPVFNSHHSETELLRYIHHLQSKDLSLVHSMIPLGSCTMKLNATTEMAPISWPEFASVHPFAPSFQTKGYRTLIRELESDLANITGFSHVSLQPNSGAQGEFTALRVIRAYLESQPHTQQRDICLIPVSAHGTNPASATMAGLRVVPVKCDTATGNLDMADLRAKCEQYSNTLACVMITYPSTFGVFEPHIKEACNLVHQHGGQVFMDGANMNAQIGLCSPGDIGADACHLNLHKTFCIPHGGGGPGVGPIGVKPHLAPYLPSHPLVATNTSDQAVAPVSGAPWGSAGILPISWSYIKMMGSSGLKRATQITLLSANYLLARLKPHYKILHTNDAGRCAHEFILDVRPFKESAGIEAVDIAKRLQDYGFHAPTMSWPVAGTLMVEPTESESKEELDRFVEALVGIRAEIAEIEEGKVEREGNVLKMAPHSIRDLAEGSWERSYSRETAAFPRPWLRERKFWPSVTRLDDAYGDTNLFCSCGPVEDMTGPGGGAAT